MVIFHHREGHESEIDTLRNALALRVGSTSGFETGLSFPSHTIPRAI